MYISDTFPYPSASQYNWSSIETTGIVDIITLRNTSNALTGRPNLHVGAYYVAIIAFGTPDASYSLYASSGQRVSLVDGRPVTASLYSGGSVFFDAVYGSGSSFSVHTVATSGTAPLWVFVSLNENIRVGVPSSYQWGSTTNSTNQEIAVPGSSCMIATCRYDLVHTPAAVPATYLFFSISTQTPNTITSLSPGVPQGGMVAVRSSLLHLPTQLPLQRVGLLLH